MDMEKLVSLCKRRGFIFQASEIYGGLNGFWDYGPLGVELKKNIKEVWWQDMVRNPPPGPDGQEITMVGLDSAIIQNPQVWVASGHASGFQDPMCSCKYCRKLYRADQVWQQIVTSPWVISLLELYDPASPHGVTGLQLKKWAEGKGKRLAPNLALVRSPEVTLSWLAEDIEKEGGKISFTDARKWISYFSTEQRAQGIVTPCPACGGDLTEPRAFNLMFETHSGALKDAASLCYLRPETAQGIFTNFKNVLDSSRVKLPFGIAQVGKAFRNEINPRNYTFRSREFEQMEIEFFCHPDESMKWYQYWRKVRLDWYSKLGIHSDKLRPREQGEKELAHYSRACTDIEYMFPFSDEPQELEGVAHRGAFDLTQHQQHSGKDLSYFEEELWAKADKSPYGGDKKKEQEAKSKPPYRYTPHVIEPSAGADRFTLAVLCEAYAEDTIGGEARTVMRFHPRLAPIKAAVLPLVNKEGMPEKAYQLYRALKQDFNVFYDDGGAIGRRYRRMDEAGTPYCITIDGETLKDDTVTIRHRDDCRQERIPLAAVADVIRKQMQS
jgi:glycyl-tRNA synthetase